jgi:predicted transcriptional regulator of viral defense system
MPQLQSRSLIRNLGRCTIPSEDLYHAMSAARPKSQPDKALALLRRSGLTRLSEFRRAGITAATISRLEATGSITRLARGLYQLADADVDANHTLAEASKLVPKGVICLTSALAYHGLTDQIPARVWLAIGPKDWRPRLTYPPMRFAHYPAEQLKRGVEHHRIDGVSVPIFSAAKTVADMFRYRRTVGLRVAIEGLREAIRERKATPAEIARHAADGGVWKVMEPYVSTLTHD